MLRTERQSAPMSKITNGRLNPVWLYPYGNSGRQMVKVTGQQ